MSGASITANTIPASAINGGISVSLPTTTMTARTATQIGYQLSVKNTSNPTLTMSSDNQLCTLTLSPVGSVWIVTGGFTFSSSSVLNYCGFGVQEGTNFSVFNYSPGNQSQLYFESETYNSSTLQANSPNHAFSCVYVVSSNANGKITLGCYPGINGGSTLNQAWMNATRIA